MASQTMKRAGDWRYATWLALLVAASAAFTLGFACAVPFAAFGAATALTLPRRGALLVALAVWLANQAIGFAILGYPWNGECLTWAAIFGGVSILTTLAPLYLANQWRGLTPVFLAALAFMAAFGVYEGGLYIISATVMGGVEIYTPVTVLRIFEINSAAFAGLLALSHLGKALTPAVTPALARV